MRGAVIKRLCTPRARVCILSQPRLHNSLSRRKYHSMSAEPISSPTCNQAAPNHTRSQFSNAPAMHPDAAVLCSQDVFGVATITLNMPRSRNALSVQMLRSLHEVFTRLATDTSTRVVVLEASGKVFSAGHNLREVAAAAGGSSEQLTDLFNLCSEVMQMIPSLPQPVIAKVDGLATAAGCQLVAACDLAYANAQTASFATPGVELGLFCSTPAVALARTRAPTKHVMEMLLLGNDGRVDAWAAERMGLINKALEGSSALDEHVNRVALLITKKSREAVAIGKPAFYQQAAQPALSDAYEIASRTMVANMMCTEAKEGVTAFCEKRAPVWAELAQDKNSRL